jgi:GNAT superfamily N-acetyltransferase
MIGGGGVTVGSMLIKRSDGFEIDNARERLDRARVHEWLSTDAYWAVGRDADRTARAIDNSECFGVYGPDGTQVAFARAVTDHATFAWICDVYVAREHRGLGLGTWLAQSIHAHLLEAGLPRLVLATADAHGVYAKAGFVPLARPTRWMEVDRRELTHK